MSRLGACASGCTEQRRDLVRAAAYDDFELVESAAHETIEALMPVIKQLIRSEPRGGDYEAAYRAVQARARQAVRVVAAHRDRRDIDVREPAEAATTWWCAECGGIDAPQPCLGICVWREVEWVEAAAYEVRRRRVLAQADAERRMRGLTGRLAWVTPRRDHWEDSWDALSTEAEDTIRVWERAR